MAKRKDFTDERVSKKQRKLERKRREKALKESGKESQKALDEHRLGWTTRDGKELQ